MAIRIVPKPEAVKPVVVHTATVVHRAGPVVVHTKRGEDRYRDPEARRSYRREWMRKRRSKVKMSDGR